MAKKRTETAQPQDQVAAARAGQAALHSYFRAGIGRQKEIAAASGLFASTLSSMAHGRSPITLEAALLIEVAAKGAVRAEVLCPARAKIIDEFLQLRTTAKA